MLGILLFVGGGGGGGGGILKGSLAFAKPPYWTRAWCFTPGPRSGAAGGSRLLDLMSYLGYLGFRGFRV